MQAMYPLYTANGQQHFLIQLWQRPPPGNLLKITPPVDRNQYRVRVLLPRYVPLVNTEGVVEAKRRKPSLANNRLDRKSVV